MTDEKKPIPGHEQIPNYRDHPSYNPKYDYKEGEAGLGQKQRNKGRTRSSTPSLEELNKPDFPPGQDPL